MPIFRSVAVPAAIAAVLASAAPGAAAWAATAAPPPAAASPSVSPPASPPPGASSPSAPAAAGRPGTASVLPAGRSWRVTLITGDVVDVTTVAGRPPQVTITPGPGRRHVIFTKFVDTRGHIRVQPQDVAPLVGKMLDPTLFDVTTLIQDGDDDARRSSLPLIVQGETAQWAASAATAAPGMQRERTLSSIDSVAYRQLRSAAARESGLLARLASAATKAGRVTPEVTGDVRYIWLDRAVRSLGTARDATAAAGAAAAAAGQPLDHNLTQIGAPAAWQAGDTGRGVTVAVLDTGIDASHPDLQGQITAEQNFTDSPDTVDRFGHGTFVAGEVAGTGAASGGARRGVAFGARLAIGKVLSDDGSGDDSTVLAGMQWAASTAGAKVISMSLGSDSPSDGTDPLSEALNQLSAADHVLFVVAAGNAGPADQTVGSPGAADAALTVGAVDGTGTLASFSSRGPRPGDGAIKPEIMAPGVDIAGLRAAGTALGPILSPSYVTLSGTSMATPEVAGAAADLFQAHPGWSPEQIKADLVDTAAPASGGDLFQVGEGVLSIGAALASRVVAGQATVNAGNIPFGTTRPVTGTLTWTNPSGQPVTLKLSADLENRDTHATPAGAIGLSSRQLTVPAGGTASATVSLDPAVLDRAPGFYEGHVVARAGQQAVTVTVPVGAFAVPQLHQLTLRATALPGTAAGQMAASAQVINVDDPDLLNAPVTFDSSGTGTIQVPPGRYWVIGEVDDLNPDDSRSALVGPPEVTVTRDTTVLLDGARAVPEKASVTGHRTLPVQMTLEVERAFAGQIDGFQFVDFSPGADPHLYAQPSGRVSVGTYTVISTYRLASPADVTQPYVYDLVKSFDHDPASLNDVVGPAQQARLARIDMRFSAVGGDHSDMSEDRIGIDKNGFGAVENPGQVPGGSARTDFITPGNGITQWTDEASAPVTLDGQKSVLDWVIENPHPEQVTAGARSVEAVAREPFAPGPESATFSATSFCQPLPSTRRVGDIHVELTDLQDLPDEFDCLGGSNPNPGWNDSTSRTMTLSQDGKVLGTEHASAADFNAPATAGTFRLTYTDDTSAAVPVSTRTDTAWTFRSAPAAGTAMDPLPLLLVGYDLPLNLDNHPDGQNAVLTVARVAGTTPAPVTSVRFWTSTDQGKTWQAVTVRPAGPGRYAVTLPKVSTGQSVSLRASASDAGGSSVDQTIITAYTG